MKKRILSAALSLGMLLTLIPPAAAAEGDVGNFADSNVTWIGTQAEYQQTLDNLYPGGAHKVQVEKKWGIVDATGEFIAPPIYDAIEPQYTVSRNVVGDPVIGNSYPTGKLFVGGYTQCVRDGKMGLLNQYGEEAIPAQYTAVGLPSDGVCRIIQKSGDKTYLGYWNLELGREIVAPNKYVVSGGNARAEGSILARQMVDSNSTMTGVGGSHNQNSGSATIDYQEISLGDDRMAAQHDFLDGYAFVTTGGGASGAQYGTIVDKTGKEILPGGPYLFRNGVYPQFGPYMVFCQLSDKDYIHEGVNLGKFYNSGVVGPEGIIIPAQYNGGVRAPASGAVVGDARMTVIPELKLVITAKDTKYGKENGGKVGVVNFQNQTVIPFTHDFNYFEYEAKHKVFMGTSDQGDRVYTAAGKRLGNNDYAEIGRENDPYSIYNGYAKIKTYREETVNGVWNSVFTDGFLNVKTGAEIFFQGHLTMGGNHTDFSTAGLVWLKNNDNKWGLLNAQGQVILPYQYDAVGGPWTREQNGFAIVNIGQKQGIVTCDGKQLVPCEYDKLSVPTNHGPAHPEFVEATKNGKVGLISAITGKTVIPSSYDGIGGMDAISYRKEYFSLGAEPVKIGKNYALVDKAGNLIPGSENNFIYTPKNGTFNTSKDEIGAEGKVIFPGAVKLASGSLVLVVRGGKVGYIPANLLARPTQPKQVNPNKATANPSPTKLLVNGKAVAASAYLIGQNNYVKLRDLAYLVNGTGKNFEVTWDGARNAINLKSGTKYTTVAGDMAPAAGGAQTATRSSSTVYVDGLGRSFTAYTINGNNYFKLRDVMRVFDIAVGYDNATATATLDTSMGYQRTEAEKAGLIPATADGAAPPTGPVNKLELLNKPKLDFYLGTTDVFHPAGFQLRYWNEKGVAETVTDTNLMEFKVAGRVIKDGDRLTKADMAANPSSGQTGSVGYKGLTVAVPFWIYEGETKTEIPATDGQTDQKLADGKYTLTVLGNTVGMSNGWAVLDSKKPVVFSVKNEGDYYSLYIEGVTANTYIGVSNNNGQLISSSKGQWTITHLGGSTYSIRQYDKPEMLVCTGAASKANGAKVMVWKNKETPKHAIFTFTPAQ